MQPSIAESTQRAAWIASRRASLGEMLQDLYTARESPTSTLAWLPRENLMLRSTKTCSCPRMVSTLTRVFRTNTF